MLLELSGTPGAGKSSIIEKLCHERTCEVVKADSSVFGIHNSNFELKVLWTIFDTYSKIQCFEQHKLNLNPHLVLLDRGLFDRIAWAKLLSDENQALTEIAGYLEKWLKGQVNVYRADCIFLFLTSYEKLITRKPDYLHKQPQPLWIVNPVTIHKLNTIYLELFEELKGALKIIVIDDSISTLSLEQKFSIVQTHIPINY